MISNPESIQFNWYNYKSRDWNSNLVVTGKDYDCMGYLKEPSYETIEKHDLRFRGYGSLEMLKRGAI